MPAFKKGRLAVEKLSEILFREYEKSDHKEFARNCAHNPVIYGTLITPIAQEVSYSDGCEGLMCGYLKKKRGGAGDSMKENRSRCFKFFGDKSKLDILCSLKAASKYNLELAEPLGILPPQPLIT